MRASARAFRDDQDGPADDSLLTSGQNNCFVKKKKSHNNNPRTAARSTLGAVLSTNKQLLNVQVLRDLILLFQFRVSLV